MKHPSSGARREVIFYGDPHGNYVRLNAEAEKHPRSSIVVLGDFQLEKKLEEEVSPALKAGCEILWIHGNHDTDRDYYYENLFCSKLSGGCLHGAVREIGGWRIAGLGGVFRGKIWMPRVGGETVFTSPEEFLSTQPPQHRWNNGLPRQHRSSIFPSEYNKMADLCADVLVCHEAPSCHPHGFEVIDVLAETMGVQLIVHGHHHSDYEDVLPNGVRVKGVGRAQTWKMDL